MVRAVRLPILTLFLLELFPWCFFPDLSCSTSLSTPYPFYLPLVCVGDLSGGSVRETLLRSFFCLVFQVVSRFVLDLLMANGVLCVVILLGWGLLVGHLPGACFGLFFF